MLGYVRGRVYYYIRGRGSHCQTAAARTHNYINRDIPRPLRIHLFPRISYVCQYAVQSRLKACLRVCLRWLAHEQQKVSSNNDTRRVNSHGEDPPSAQCCARFIIYRNDTSPPRTLIVKRVYPEAIMRFRGQEIYARNDLEREDLVTELSILQIFPVFAPAICIPMQILSFVILHRIERKRNLVAG